MKALTEIFDSFGYPNVILSDNGPQFRGPFKEFCEEIGVEHTPSSPYHPASNGLSESAVKILKRLLSKANRSGAKFQTSLHAWRNMPRADKTAPADLLFGFRQRTPGALPRLSHGYVNREEAEKTLRARRDDVYGARGGTELQPLQEGSLAFLQNRDGTWTEEVTIGPMRRSGRSYVVFAAGGEKMIRNRRFLRPCLDG